MNFLIANWTNLVMLNYEVPLKAFQHLIPFGTEADSFDGKYYFSIVIFDFEKTKIMGMPIPYFGNFVELNLRFYVKRIEDNQVKRGVCFVKEYVPHAIVAFIAQSLYQENYYKLPLSNKHQANKLAFKVSDLDYLQLEYEDQQTDLEKGSLDEFILEHYWGYTAHDNLKTLEYAVQHPKWRINKITALNYKFDYTKLYGEDFAKYLVEPASIVFTKGSDISVSFGKELKIYE